MENQNSQYGSELTTRKRPRINPACIEPKNQVWGDEKYTLKMDSSVVFFHRVDAVLRTREMAIKKQMHIILLLNEVRFCRFYPNGDYKYIYDSSLDLKASPQLKQLFKQKGIAIN